MPQSLACILVHMIFSTKNRVPVLTPEIQAELHPYLAVVLREYDCPSLQVGGVEDHVHLLFGLSRTRTVAQVVETVKTSSSKWIKTQGAAFTDFIGNLDMEGFPSASPMRMRLWPTSAIRRSITRK